MKPIFNKTSITLAATTLALVLSGTAFAESAEKLEKAHEKAESDIKSMDAKQEAKMEKAHEKAEADIKSMDAKQEAKVEKAHEKAEAHLEKIEAK